MLIMLIYSSDAIVTKLNNKVLAKLCKSKPYNVLSSEL